MDDLSDTDRLICATLAAAKAASEKKEKHGQYLLEYEIMVRTMLRRRAAVSDRAGDASEEAAAFPSA